MSPAPSATRYARPSRRAPGRASRWCSPVARRREQCYERLAKADGIDWGVVDIYVGDERVVPPDDVDANQRLIRESLIEPVGGVGSFSPMPTVGPVDECVEAYQQTMSDLVTGPGIDLIHLGMGPDGHTASLFPNAPTLEAEPGVLVAGDRGPQRRQPAPAADPDPGGDQFGPPRRLHGGRGVEGPGGRCARARRRPARRPRPCRTDVVAGRRRRARRLPLDWPQCSLTPIFCACPSRT